MIFTVFCQESGLLQNFRAKMLLETLHIILKQPKFLEEIALKAEIQRLEAAFPLESKSLACLSLLLCLTGTFPHVPSPVPYSFSPPDRLLYRKTLKSLRIYVDEGHFANCAEGIVARYIGNHPLVAHEPDEVLQTLARYGVKEYERRRTATTAAHTFDKIKGFFTRIYSTHPSTTHTSLIYSYIPLTSSPSLSLTIVIPGWLSVHKDMQWKWQGLLTYAIPCKVTALRWDADSLKSLALSGAVMNFHRACKKAKFAGKQLARHIASQAFGMGPVSLIGFSLGARVIFHALKALSELSESRIYVQDVILLGGAVQNDANLWAELLPQVAGRVINVYSRHDLVLRRIYTLAMLGKPVGQGPVRCCGLQNFDASSYVKGHKEHTRELAKTLNLLHYQP